MENNKKLWFKRKTYGWGWTPSSWEGWFVLILYLIFLFRITIVSDLDNPTSGSDALFAFAVPVVFATSLLIFICYKKGEKPKWQWGGKE